MTVDTTTGVGTVTVPEGTLTSAIDAVLAETQEGKESTIVIKPDIEAGAQVKTVDVALPLSDLKEVAESAVDNIKIETAVGEVTLDTEAIKDLIAGAAEGDTTVDVVVEHKTATTAADVEADETLTGDQKTTLTTLIKGETFREVYDIAVLFGGSKTPKEFTTTGYLTIGLPYTLKAGEVGGNVWPVYVKTDGKTEDMKESRTYDAAKSLSIFKTQHLSVYAVVYDPTKTAGEEKPGEETPPVETPEDNPPTDDAPTGSSGGGCEAEFAGLALLLAAPLFLRKKD